jgi:sialic acid synthase SpsE
MAHLNEYGFKTNNQTYVIAEIGINHGGSLSLAKELIDAAAESGADAAKFQTYLTEKRVPKQSPIFDILKKCELPLESFEELKRYADSRKIQFFSTPFDFESVDCLEKIGTPIYKIASFDSVNKQLLEYVAQKSKPTIMSVGMTNLKEIIAAYNILTQKTSKIALLHCISSYPTKELDANLSCIQTLKQNFNCIVGQSDHTSGIKIPILAVAAGAQIIEKHFKISDSMECIDAPVSISMNEMKKMISSIREIEQIMGNPSLEARDAEKQILPFRRFS